MVHIDEVVEDKEVIVHTHIVSPEMVMLRRIIYYFLDIVEGLLAIRFALKVFGADASGGFTHFTYSITGPLVAPFIGIFPSPVSGGMIIEWATLIAMLIYALVVYAVLRLILLLTITD